MRFILKLIALALIVFVIKLIWVNKAEAGGPWNDQYCNVETTQIRVVDTQGNVIENRVEEKVVCEDGAKDFLHGMGIADSCQMFTWMMPLQGTVIRQRDIACHKMNGEYEIVQGYHSID
jgi:hypothetical protein|tara:strand:+ start:2848 stop:3204 length:357 start_codon:yes stop_codon:yes gene_type:complete